MAEANPINAPLKVYEDGLNRGKIIYQTCEDCGAVAFYPRIVCPNCGSSHIIYKASGGKGCIYTRTVIYPRHEEPYNVVLIDMDEGFRIMSTVEDIANDDIYIGMRVELKMVYPVEESNAKSGQLPKHVFKEEGS